MFLDVFMSNLDENGSNLLLSCHIALTICSVLLSGETCRFDRKEDFRSNLKEEQRFDNAPKNRRRQDEGSHAVLQSLGPCTAVHGCRPAVHRGTTVHPPACAVSQFFGLFVLISLYIFEEAFCGVPLRTN